MLIRNLKESDYESIITVLDSWWGGRPMTTMLPRLFFKHFNHTSFVIEKNNQVIAFIIGFLSQVYPNQAYVHFIGIHPDYRKQGLGRQLYEVFFAIVKAKGCDTVFVVTSPVNKGSVAFHTQLGFQIQEGDCMIEGVAVNTEYDGPGEDRIIFWKRLM